MTCECKKLEITDNPALPGSDLHRALERSGVAGDFWAGALSAALAVRAGRCLPAPDAD